MFQLRARLTINNAAQFRLPLVIKLLAFRDADLEFNASALDINASYYECHSRSRGCLIELVDLLAMQQLARAQRIMIFTIAVRVRRDVRVEQPSFTFAHTHVRVFQLNATIEDA